jgi:uncharacterized membrane protein
MKIAVTIMLTLALASLFGCRRGESMKAVGFKIAVPTSNTEVKQGELQTVVVSLQRDSLFKKDVKLQAKAPKGISVEPTSVTIKASDKPDVQLQIAAPKDAALGEYPVVVTGTPGDGVPISVGFTVKVIAP